jgi:hypothetical protein
MTQNKTYQERKLLKKKVKKKRRLWEERRDRGFSSIDPYANVSIMRR